MPESKHLQLIFDKYGCDRGSGRHNYQRVYKDLKAASLLEIGIYKGAGLHSWREFLPDAEIAGIDTFQRVPPEQIKGLTDFIWWQGDSRTIEIDRMFDVIIDDGCHHPDAQLQTFHNLRRLVNPDGRYFIEDVFPGKWDCSALFKAADWRHHDLRTKAVPDSYILELRC